MVVPTASSSSAMYGLPSGPTTRRCVRGNIYDAVNQSAAAAKQHRQALPGPAGPGDGQAGEGREMPDDWPDWTPLCCSSSPASVAAARLKL